MALCYVKNGTIYVKNGTLLREEWHHYVKNGTLRGKLNLSCVKNGTSSQESGHLKTTLLS